MYRLVGTHYQKCEPNERDRDPVEPLGIELGIWQGEYMNQPLPWLRVWNSVGELLPTGDERAEQESARAERLADKLRSLGINPDEV